jgi:hypothetical protein
MDSVLAHMYIYVFLCECNGHLKTVGFEVSVYAFEFMM